MGTELLREHCRHAVQTLLAALRAAEPSLSALQTVDRRAEWGGEEGRIGGFCVCVMAGLCVMKKTGMCAPIKGHSRTVCVSVCVFKEPKDLDILNV